MLFLGDWDWKIQPFGSVLPIVIRDVQKYQISTAFSIIEFWNNVVFMYPETVWETFFGHLLHFLLSGKYHN